MANRKKADADKMKKKLQLQVTEQMFQDVEAMVLDTNKPYSEMIREDLQRRINHWKAKAGQG